jgi:RNA polymerase sigma-70 factor (ECF subfamily)
MAAGDAGALREFYELHAGRVYAIAARVLSNREDVREVVQDSFIKAWRQARSYRPDRGEAVSWLLFIARNTAIDRLRQGARQRLALASLANEPDLRDRSLQPACDGQEFLDHLLSNLSPAQCEALDLAFFSGFSQAEIAKRMNTPVGNVKNHLRRGLLKLRELATFND